MATELTSEEVATIKRLRAEGRTHQDIATIMGRGLSTVKRILKARNG